MVETDVMEPLVNYLDRLEPAWLENGFQTELGTFKIEVGEIIMETSL